MNTESAEKALVARLLIDPEQITPGVLTLSADEFSVPNMGKAFDVIVKRHSAGESIDDVLVSKQAGVEIDVMELSPASFAPVDKYVEVIHDAAIRRSVASALDAARTEVVKGSGDPLDIVSRTVERVARVAGNSGGLRKSSEVVRAYRDEFPRRGGAKGGLPYGIPALDSALLPMRAGRLVVFASRPGIGKTALAESVSDYAASRGPVLFVSLEMTAEELMDRSMARQSGINAQEIIRGSIDVSSLDSHLTRSEGAPIYYVDQGSTTTTEILSAAQQVKMVEGDLSLVIVDYLQLVADKGDNEVYRVGAISHALKRLAMKMRVPVLAAAQLNRSIEAEGRKPRLSDLRDSGAIEQDADVVMIMTGQPYKPERQLHILKQRQGSTGVVDLLFDGDTQRWSSPPAKAATW